MSCGSLQIVETEPGVFIVQESGFNLFNWETVKKKKIIKQLKVSLSPGIKKAYKDHIYIHPGLKIDWCFYTFLYLIFSYWSKRGALNTSTLTPARDTQSSAACASATGSAGSADSTCSRPALGARHEALSKCLEKY